MDQAEEIRRRAFEVRRQYRAGLISYEEAAKELEEYRQLFDAKAEELARKYGVPKQKFKASHFLNFRL